MKNRDRGNVKLTEAEVAYFSKSSTIADGMWEPALQKAVAQALLDFYPAKGKQKLDNREVMYNLERFPASAGSIQKILTGAKAKEYAKEKYSSADWGRVLNEALGDSDHLMLVQGMTPAHSGSAYLPGDHWYAVLAYDSASQKVTVWNPWGDDRVGRVDGIFTMTLQNFYDGFAWIVVQQ